MEFVEGLSLETIFKIASIALGAMLVVLALAYPKTREALALLGLRLAEAAVAFAERWLSDERRSEVRRERMLKRGR
jgi:hypothetical protein